MAKSKRYQECEKQIDRTRAYSVDEALDLLLQATSVKFDETVEIAVTLGIDPKKSDQMVRGTLVLPHGTGKSVRVIVITKGADAEAAKEAGADHVGCDELIDKIKKGWLDFDAVIATPDVMRDLAKLGKILGPRGLMPSPKNGTVTKEVVRVVNEFKAGKIEFKIDRQANLHVPVGKKSFSKEQLKDNLLAIMKGVVKARPVTSKGIYIKGIHISSTMGCGIKIDTAQMAELMR